MADPPVPPSVLLMSDAANEHEPFDLQDMAVFIARVIHGVATGGDMEEFDTMTDKEQAEFVELGAAAMKAHASYFKAKGCRVLHPGVVQVPLSTQEAQMMIASGSAYLQAHRSPIMRAKTMPGPMQ